MKSWSDTTQQPNKISSQRLAFIPGCRLTSLFGLHAKWQIFRRWARHILLQFNVNQTSKFVQFFLLFCSPEAYTIPSFAIGFLYEIGSYVFQLLQRLRETFESGKTKDVSFRIQQLKNLQRMYRENVELFVEAVRKDLRKVSRNFHSFFHTFSFECELRILLGVKSSLLPCVECQWNAFFFSHDMRRFFSKSTSVLMTSIISCFISTTGTWFRIIWLQLSHRHFTKLFFYRIKDEYVAKNLLTLMDTPVIHYEPFGVCLLIGAWNYPVHVSWNQKSLGGQTAHVVSKE